MPTLSKYLKRNLALMAGKLPETTAPFREKVTGTQLLKENITHLPDKSKVLPNQLYGRWAQRPVNHARRVCAAFEQRGRAGVLAYCTPYIEPENLALFSAKLSELVPA